MFDCLYKLENPYEKSLCINMRCDIDCNMKHLFENSQLKPTNNRNMSECFLQVS